MAASTAGMHGLHLCRSIAEACLGAVEQEPPGVAVAVSDRDGVLVLRWAEATVLGPVERQVTAPETGFIEQLVADSLKAGEHDVWLACADPAMAGRMGDAAALAGHPVHAAPASLLPPVAGDPFNLFQLRRVRALGRGGVLTFCELDPATHAPLEVGTPLGMAAEATPEGGTEVAYVDAEGWLVGLHGHLPGALDELALVRLGEVRVEVQSISWNRRRDGTPVQMLAFEIPDDVDALLSGAKVTMGGEIIKPS